MTPTASEKRLARLSTSLPSPHGADDTYPFSELSPVEMLLLQHLPSRYSIGPDGGLVYKAKSPLRSSHSMSAKKPKAKKLKRSMTRHRSRSPSYPQVNPFLHPQPYYYAPQPLPPPKAPLPPPARSSSSWSIFSFLHPSLPLLLTIVAASVAIIYVSRLLMPISHSLANVVDTIAAINPIHAMGEILGPASTALAAIPIGTIWCNGVGFGCQGVDRNAAYTTESFTALEVPHASEQISLGNDFFDCLNDLRIARTQKTAVSHLMTLAPKVMQWDHVLESPEELSANIIALARARRDIVMNANAARVAGSGGVGKIINEFENVRFLSNSRLSQVELQKELSDGLSSAQQSLQDTADYTLASSQAVKSSGELAERVAAQAHREISRLRRINNEEEKGLPYLVYGWTRSSWKYLQPGLEGFKQDREMAGEFLKELVKVVDRGAEAHLSTAMALQQCAVNTQYFNEQVQKAFSFDRHSASVSSQIKHLLPRIDGLGVGLTQLKKNDALQVAGPQNPPPPATVNAEPVAAAAA